jgi:hypothetical protein
MRTMQAPSMTGFGSALIKLAIRVALDAYSGKFDDVGGKILYANHTIDFERPVFYVVQINETLWIAVRGSRSVYDYLTCGEFNETKDPLGIFHLGSWRAAQYVYNQVQPFVKAHNGVIYCTGHSYGASVAPLIAVQALNDCPGKDVNSISYAALPVMDNETSLKYKEKIVSIVNNIDCIPTLSVLNMYETLKLLIPYLEKVDEAWLIAYLESVLQEFQIFMPMDLYEAILKDIPAVVDAILGHCHGEVRYIRYPAGRVYQLQEGKPKPLIDAEVDPVKTLNYLHLSVRAFQNHLGENYRKVVAELPDDPDWWY